MNQESAGFALFLKGLVVVAGAATGLLGILVALAIGAAIVKGAGNLLSKLGKKASSVLKRKPKQPKTVVKSVDPRGGETIQTGF